MRVTMLDNIGNRPCDSCSTRLAVISIEASRPGRAWSYCGRCANALRDALNDAKAALAALRGERR